MEQAALQGRKHGVTPQSLTKARVKALDQTSRGTHLAALLGGGHSVRPELTHEVGCQTVPLSEDGKVLRRTVNVAVRY